MTSSVVKNVGTNTLYRHFHSIKQVRLKLMNSTHGETTPSVKSVGMTASIIAFNVMNAIIGFITNVLDFQKTSSNYIAPNFDIEIFFVARDAKFDLSPLVSSVVILPLMISQMNAQSVTKPTLHLLLCGISSP